MEKLARYKTREEKKGKARLFFEKFKGRLMAGGVSLLLLGGAAGCSGCNKPSKEYMQKIDEQKKTELSPEEQKKLTFELVEVVLRTGGKGIGIVEAYLEQGADPNAIDGLGRGPAIVRIARIGNLETLELVLEKGGDANARDVKGETPLMESASSSHDSVKKVELLLKKGAEVDAKNNDGETALMRAAFDGNTGVMETLMEAGADVNAKDNEGNSVLMIACNPFGSEEAMELLIEKGADVNAVNNSGVSVLDHYNAYCKPMVELLEKKNEVIDEFILAAQKDKTDRIKEMLENGMWVDAKDRNGETALMAASAFGHEEIAELLIEKGADVNAKGYDGESSLFMASNWGHLETVEVLVDAGADVNAKNVKGWTPLTIASLYGHKDIIKFLKENGAKE